jgi:hypothetical protein
MATVPAGALRQRVSRVRSRSRSSSDVEPSQFTSVNVREAFIEASWLSSWAISLSGHGTAPSWRLGVYDLEVISPHIVDLETAQLLYPGTSEHAKVDQVGQRGEPSARTRLCTSSAPLSSSTRAVAARSRVPLSFRCSERRSPAGQLRCNLGRSVIRISPPSSAEANSIWKYRPVERCRGSAMKTSNRS